jgi:Fe-S cluster biogenesis protein NfuA
VSAAYGPCGAVTGITRTEYREFYPAAVASFRGACAECGSTRETVTRDADLMEDVQGFPLPDAPICCEVTP